MKKIKIFWLVGALTLIFGAAVLMHGCGSTTTATADKFTVVGAGV